MKNDRIRYYTDPLNDEFAGTDIKTRRVPPDFCYVHKSVLWRVASFLIYYCFAVPVVFITAKLILGLRFENRRVLRKLRDKGCFLYANHTNVFDAYVPALAAFPRRGYTVAGPDIISIPGIRNLVMMLGALPIPSDHKTMRRFTEAIAERCAERSFIAIYPEAHIWPYYTGIRPFTGASFCYPVMNGAPAVAMVTTYRKRKGLFALCKRPGMTVTFSEPFYPDPSLSKREAQKKLRDQVYGFMTKVSNGADQVCYIRYEPADNARS